MDLEVRHLSLVLAVAEEGTLTRAAERLHLSQSALSHQLLGIERRLRVPLFHRVSKRMVLTQAGERLLRSSRRILDELARTEEEIRLFADSHRGVLRLTTECSTCYHWLPAVLRRFQLRHPSIDVAIDVEATAAPLEALAAGRIDLALVSSEGRDRRMILRPLFRDEMVVLVAREHPFASQPYVRPRQLAEETLLTYAGLDDSLVYQRVLLPLGLTPRHHLQVRLTEAVVELVRNRIGVSVVARWSVAPHIAAGAVVALPLSRRGFWRDWRAATLRSPGVPAYVEDFVALVAREAPAARDVPAYLPQRRPRRAG
jgi:LysR family transcriptional regulator for metE and metH